MTRFAVQDITAGRLAFGSWALLLCLMAAGCASDPYKELAPSANALDNYLAGRAGQAPGSEGTYTTHDGRELAFIDYPAAGRPAKVALVYLHGIESHAGWFDSAARMLAKRGYDVFCVDRRGSGINRENRGFVSGDTRSFYELFADIRYFIEPLRPHYDAVYIVGLSWGGKLATAYGLTEPDDCDGLVLITPGLRALVDVSGGEKLGIVFGSVFNPTAQFKTPIEPEMFTTTPEHLAYIKDDPLRLHTASARFFLNSAKLDSYVDKHMSKNRLPILLFLAGQDQIIDNDAAQRLLERGGQDILDVVRYEDQTHSIQFDAPKRLTEDMDRWLRKQEERRQPGPEEEAR